MSKLENRSVSDWHSEDIKAAIRKRGVSVAELARANGYDNYRTFMNVLRMPYPKIERIIAEFLEVEPSEIWPSRYQQPIKIRPSVHRKVA